MSAPPFPGPVLVVCTGNICRSPFAAVSRWARSAPGPGAEIADPYRRGEEAAAAAASRIWDTCEQLDARLRGDGDA